MLGFVMDTATVVMGLMRINVDHNVENKNSGVKMVIVSTKTGSVMVLLIVKIIRMK